MGKQDNLRVRTVEAIEAIVELRGSMSFTVADVHDLAGGNSKSVGIYLSKFVRACALERHGKGIYCCKDIGKLRHIANISEPTKNKPLKLVKPKKPEISLEEAKMNITWVFDEYIPYLEQLVRDLMSFVNKYGDKAREAKVIHQDRLYEEER